ncbi:MAG: hypothetical protein R3A79_22000 [Nannocystaceae bacterium]
MYLTGFCTFLCESVADCVPKPNVPAVTECIPVNADQSACALKCGADADCPVGMTCESIDLGTYCW